MTGKQIWTTALLSFGYFTSAALGLINPDFTPIDMVRQSGTILVLSPDTLDGEDQAVLTVEKAIKGQAPTAPLRLDLTPLETAARGDLTKLLGGEDKATLALVFVSQDAANANLHVAGRWFPMEPADAGAWRVMREDSAMSGLLSTWRGGTDMLQRAVTYILAYPAEAQVPTEAGFGWDDAFPIGEVAGDVRAVYPVRLQADGPMHLFIAASEGDVLLRGGEEPEDVTDAVGLDAISAATVWGDVNGDGLLDLISADDEGGLTLWLQGDDGRLTAQALSPQLPAPVLGLALIRTDNGLQLLAMHGKGVVILAGDGDDFTLASEIEADAALREELGTPGQAIAADLTGTGHLDVLQVYEQGALLYRGGVDGALLAVPQQAAVSAQRGAGRLALADFDADGLLDVVVTSLAGVRIYQNMGDGRFVESRHLSGETSYKTQRFASSAAVGDPNGDGRQDLLVTYMRETPGIFFNRGFRGFGFAAAQSEELESFVEVTTGQTAACFADLNGNAAEDLVVILRDGEIWYVINTLGSQMPLALEAQAPLDGGPVVVACAMDSRSLGARVAAPGRPAIFSIPEPQAYRLDWHDATATPGSTQVFVVSEPVRVVLEEN